MERAKAADGYLPKWRSNHLPRRREEKERERERKKQHYFNFDDTAVFCCHPAASSGTATSATQHKPCTTFLSSILINRMFKQLTLGKCCSDWSQMR